MPSQNAARAPPATVIRWRFGIIGESACCRLCRRRHNRHTFAVHSITRWSQDGWSYEKMLPMLTAYMGNVREKGLLRYFELTPSRYRAQLACLDVRTRAPDVAIRPANSDRISPSIPLAESYDPSKYMRIQPRVASASSQPSSSRLQMPDTSTGVSKGQ
jgi:hypothetical protein